MRPRCKNRQPSESAGKNKGKVEGRGGGRDCSLTLCISIRWGRGKEVMGNFLGYDLLWCTMFSFEKGRSAFKKKNRPIHTSLTNLVFHLSQVYVGWLSRVPRGISWLTTPINSEVPTPRFQRTSKKI